MPTPDPSTLDERLRAVERALSDTDREFTDIEQVATLADGVEQLGDRLSAVERQVGELEATTQALRGYVGAVRSVNEDVEHRAETALAAVRSVERRVDRDGPVLGPDGESAPSTADAGSPSDRSDPSTVDTDPWAASAFTPAGDGASGTGQSGDLSESQTSDEDRVRPDGGYGGDPVPESGTATGTETVGGWGSPVDHRGGATATSIQRDGWPPDGMDVDRAQPWPTPPKEPSSPSDDDRDGTDTGIETVLRRVLDAL